MMSTSKRNNVERIGHWFGLRYRGYVRRERMLIDWLIARGTPAFAASALLWVIKRKRRYRGISMPS